MEENLSRIRFSRQASMRQQLSHQLRELIVSGEMSEGDRLPSNQQLAERWQVAASSVQAAMSSLTKEGLLQRARKRGTFVAKRPRTLTQVAIYLADDIWHMPQAAFRRAVVASLGSKLRERKVIPAIWSDTRSASNQRKPWPELVRAAESRQIQAILMCSGHQPQSEWLARLPVPLASVTNRADPNSVRVDMALGERMAVEELAAKGCRSVGVITLTGFTASGRDDLISGGTQSVRTFRRTAQALGLALREQWIRSPDSGVMIDEAGAERFGYEQMKQLLAAPDRPDGLFITYDWVARGAIMAVLESRIKVPQKLKLVLHRNVEIGMLCPVTASFLDFSIGEVAGGLISLMDGQLRGAASDNILVRPRIATI